MVAASYNLSEMKQSTHAPYPSCQLKFIWITVLSIQNSYDIRVSHAPEI